MTRAPSPHTLCIPAIGMWVESLLQCFMTLSLAPLHPMDTGYWIIGRNGTSNLYPASPLRGKIRGNQPKGPEPNPSHFPPAGLNELKLPSGSAAPAQVESSRKRNSARFGHSLWPSTSHLSHPASKLPILSSTSQCLSSHSAAYLLVSSHCLAAFLCIRRSWHGHSALAAKSLNVVSPGPAGPTRAPQRQSPKGDAGHCVQSSAGPAPGPPP
jgi:hypothetical protein